MSKRGLFIFLLSVVFLGYGNILCAQKIEESDTRGMIQANFLYQFAANNNWPVAARSGKFTIGILGNTSVFDQMSEKYAAKPIGTQTIEIVKLTSISDNRFFHILYIDKSKKSELTKAVKEYKTKNTLIVTNWEGAMQAGAQINFKTIDGNIRYELDDASMKEKKITAGVKILQWKVE
ncbi:MAG: YfiR family protein [Crocinitomicaceae bacterium]|nr:YfiR family protein [Crocinitomicaceae bacterium]